jgi:prepilin-type N-terminal cleavage/methylation domain-containing protein
MGGKTMLKNKKGFTLIELLIVVAIIAILAAIAIPQFSSYRIRGFNSAATADTRNARTAQEAFFSDWQVYASSTGAGPAVAGVYPAGVAAAAGTAMRSGFGVAYVAGIINGSAPTAATTFSTGVSQGVGVVINSTAGSGSNYTIIAKNDSGDRCFGADSDTTAIYWVNGVVGQGFNTAGAGMVNAAVPASTTANTDFPGVAGVAPCNGNPATVGQVNWTTL